MECELLVPGILRMISMINGVDSFWTFSAVILLTIFKNIIYYRDLIHLSILHYFDIYLVISICFQDISASSHMYQGPNYLHILKLSLSKNNSGPP